MNDTLGMEGALNLLLLCESVVEATELTIDEPENRSYVENQKEIDVLAAYVGDRANLFRYKTTANSGHRLIYTKAMEAYPDSAKKKTPTYNAHVFLDLTKMDTPIWEIELKMQVGTDSVIINRWSLAHPHGMAECQRVIEGFIVLTSHNKEIL